MRARATQLIRRWRSDDLRSVWLRRCEAGDDGRVLGSWSREARGFETVPQHELLRQALALAERLTDAGVGPGRPAVIDCLSPRVTLLAYVAAVLSGGLPAITPVYLVARAGPGARARELHAGLGAACIISDRPQPAGADVDAREGAAPPMVIDPTGTRPASVVPTTLPGASDPGDPAHLQLTSGSTSAPKAAVVTHGNVMANCLALGEVVDMGPDDSAVSWLPLYHDMGLVGMALVSLLQGTDVHLLTPFDFLAHPDDWLRAISLTGAAVTSSPTFGYQLAVSRTTDAVIDQLDLSALRIACCGGEPVLPSVLEAFERRFAPTGLREGVLRPCYGLAEATLAVTFARTGSLPVVALDHSALAPDGHLSLHAPAADGVGSPVLSLVSVGPPVAGTEVVILDPATGRPRVGEDLTGEVAVRGPGVTPGYWQEGMLRRRRDAWLATGDVGFLHDRELYVVERADNLLIRNGQNYPAHPLEAALAAACGLDADGVMIVDRDIYDPGGDLTAVIEVGRRADPVRLVERAAVAGRGLELRVDDVVVVRRGGLPRTSSGKKQHAALREALRARTIPTLAARRTDGASDVVTPEGSTEPAVIDLRESGASGAGRSDVPLVAVVLDEVRQVCEPIGTSGAVGLDVSLHDDLAVDSLALFALAVALEDRTGRAISAEQLVAARTPRDLVDALASSNGAAQEEGIHALTTYVEAIPQINLVVDHQQGRTLRVAGRTVADFASCNYLGLDHHPTVIDAIDPMVREWGVHPSWTRAVASPAPYRTLEQRLAALVGAPDTVLFPTVSLLHLGVLPKLAGPRGALLVDESAHHSIHEAAELAASRGSRVVTFRHGDLDDLSAKLRLTASHPSRVVALDGVYSMSGAVSDLPAVIELAESGDARVYVDDAHGFGVLGQGPEPAAPYGRHGSGMHRFCGVGLHPRLVYVAGLSKAYSSMGAFVTCSGPQERAYLMSASTLVFSGPVPTASLASALAGLRVNELEGDEIRARLHRLTARMTDGVRDLGLEVSNDGNFPIVTVELGPLRAVADACRVLWDHGILITPAVFPAAPLEHGGVRLSVTAVNSDDDVDRAVAALGAARDAAKAAAVGATRTV